MPWEEERRASYDLRGKFVYFSGVLRLGVCRFDTLLSNFLVTWTTNWHRAMKAGRESKIMKEKDGMTEQAESLRYFGKYIHVSTQFVHVTCEPQELLQCNPVVLHKRARRNRRTCSVNAQFTE